jgi:hypothetical protein
LCAVGVWRPDPKKRRPDHVSILRGGVCAPGDVCRPEKEAASEHGETASFIAVGEHAYSDSVARRHGESDRSGGCISKEGEGAAGGRRRGVRTAVMTRSPSHD